ncbi:short-chain dehydrogenase/reductase family Oxidoreductase [Colletotrichum orchidophilum]|uniref:Short-chain dehydrogenase/reductase family Oxidoreductase n=1 Tax=Colletotrichum orchidophilum TaxID=1209926 RepID=A0A1G4BKJ3_9PEZI|nr:short-chain dehydrogenase/reductase family Oxidoreductase [Colletotrichum orchidophilum]OHF01962.1 short-chain dehydrogenase/reductase family Oxidoreductase [Colletotrichum orchidophilum]
MAPTRGRQTTGTELVAEYASHIAGKTILVTGVSPGGLGAAFAQAVAAGSPALLLLAGRNTAKVQQTADAITSSHPSVAVRALELDLGSFKSVREAAETVNGWDNVPHIDVLVNNAGIMATEWSKTEDGFESQFGTNHLGPFLFTNLIMNKVLAAQEARIVTVSSDGHRLSHIRWTDYNFNDGKHYNRWIAYGQSKTANCLMALSLAEKLASKGLLSVSLHPGVIFTNLANHLEGFDSLREQEITMGTKFMWTDFDPKTEDQGIATHVYAAFSPDIKGLNGQYFNDCRVADQYEEEIYPWANNKIEADKLWKLSEKLVGQEFNY